MKFISNKVAFGRHESFPLRYGWLTKGFQAFEKDNEIFGNDDAVVTLGVGKNMVSSIRHWLRATRLIDIETEIKKTNELGRKLLAYKNGWDPYLEDEATIWLIHWLLATNPQHSTSWFWFFNYFHKPEFTSQEVGNALVDFAKENIDAKFSLGTIKRDCAVLLRTYIQSKDSSKMPAEEMLDSPLSLLRLITYSSATKTFRSLLEKRDNLPLSIFGYAIADLFQQLSITEIPIEELMYSRDGHIAPGLLFRLSESGLLAKLEKLTECVPGSFKIDETAGVHQLYKLKDIDPFLFLEKHYNTLQLQDEAS